MATPKTTTTTATSTTKQEGPFLVNLLPHTLTCIQGNIVIPAAGYKKISEQDRTEQSINWAVSRGWATITNVEPKEGSTASGVIITTHTPYTGMSEAELKEHKAMEDTNTPKTTSVQIGGPEHTGTKAK